MKWPASTGRLMTDPLEQTIQAAAKQIYDELLSHYFGHHGYLDVEKVKRAGEICLTRLRPLWEAQQERERRLEKALEEIRNSRHADLILGSPGNDLACALMRIAAAALRADEEEEP